MNWPSSNVRLLRLTRDMEAQRKNLIYQEEYRLSGKKLQTKGELLTHNHALNASCHGKYLTYKLRFSGA